MLGIFLDIETTGLDPLKHRILEIAFVLVDLDSGEERERYESIVSHNDTVWAERDLESIEVNGFTRERMDSGKSQSLVKEEVMAIFRKWKIVRRKAVFICQNPSFDRAFFAQLVPTYTQEELQWPYHWLDMASMNWALQVQREQEKRGFAYSGIPLSKDGIARQLKLKEEAQPHRAMNGVEHLYLCYRALLHTGS